jgi:NAD(P)H-dependent flavin oxidoreductase YrpB (nitropropane dioxygenase family)
MANPKLPTRLTAKLGIDHPIMLAGMAPAAGPDLVAAVSNAGGIGTLGAIALNPVGLRRTIQETRAKLKPGAKLGVDLLLPMVGGNARATNKDYTQGALDQLIDVMVEEKVDLFVCAVGVPPKYVVDRLHDAGIPVMNMIGDPKHVKACAAAGVDIIGAQGTEAGGHTGEISTLVLIPQVVDAAREHGMLVVGAGGIWDGRGVAACLALGADGVWVGSRFLVTPEANVPDAYKQALISAQSGETMRSAVYTGRPVRVLTNKCAAPGRVRATRPQLSSGRARFAGTRTSTRRRSWRSRRRC